MRSLRSPLPIRDLRSTASDADGGVGFVDVLTAGCAEGVDAQVGGFSSMSFTKNRKVYGCLLSVCTYGL